MSSVDFSIQYQQTWNQNQTGRDDTSAALGGTINTQVLQTNMPVLSCVCTTQNYTNTVMNLPEVSRSQSPSSLLTNKVEATAYVDFLEETGYKRLADGNIQALQAQLPQHLSKICT